MPTDWQDLDLSTFSAAVVDPRRRLRLCLGAFAVLLSIVLFRAAEMQFGQAGAFREAACGRSTEKNRCLLREGEFWLATKRCWRAIGS